MTRRRNLPIPPPDTEPGEGDFITVMEAARRYPISRATLFRWLGTERIVAYRRPGLRDTLIDRRHLDAIMRPRMARQRAWNGRLLA